MTASKSNVSCRVFPCHLPRVFRRRQKRECVAARCLTSLTLVIEPSRSFDASDIALYTALGHREAHTWRLWRPFHRPILLHDSRILTRAEDRHTEYRGIDGNHRSYKWVILTNLILAPGILIRWSLPVPQATAQNMWTLLLAAIRRNGRYQDWSLFLAPRALHPRGSRPCSPRYEIRPQVPSFPLQFRSSAELDAVAARAV
ncbi:hypothetical protein LXA43DRAFT_399309 [Ganoderma leucocontextum]|nr:hypothetical protein LXA43DRAFT_399309 [Ganoderma leucocontextum]